MYMHRYIVNNDSYNYSVGQQSSVTEEICMANDSLNPYPKSSVFPMALFVRRFEESWLAKETMLSTYAASVYSIYSMVCS